MKIVIIRKGFGITKICKKGSPGSGKRAVLGILGLGRQFFLPHFQLYSTLRLALFCLRFPFLLLSLHPVIIPLFILPWPPAQNPISTRVNRHSRELHGVRGCEFLVIIHLILVPVSSMAHGRRQKLLGN